MQVTYSLPLLLLEVSLYLLMWWAFSSRPPLTYFCPHLWAVSWGFSPTIFNIPPWSMPRTQRMSVHSAVIRSIYRKAIITDILIHGKSFCPFPIKSQLSTFSFTACIPFPLPLTFTQEVSILKQFAKTNMFNIDIDGIIRKKSVCLSLHTITTLHRPSPRTKKRR